MIRIDFGFLLLELNIYSPYLLLMILEFFLDLLLLLFVLLHSVFLLFPLLLELRAQDFRPILLCTFADSLLNFYPRNSLHAEDLIFYVASIRGRIWDSY